MTILRIILLLFLLVCAIAVSFSRHLLISIAIYMGFSLSMSVIWLLLESPDLAITEAAVGAGVTSILFFVMLKKIRSIRTTADQKMQDSHQKRRFGSIVIDDLESDPDHSVQSPFE